jgi:hypothetical protein
MKDAAGTSMSLNVDIDPSSGTPILSGRAINAQGDVLDVHPCSCNNPIAPRHNLAMPRSPALCPHARDLSHMYPSPLSPHGAHRRPTPIFTRNRTPLVLVQTRLPESPSAAELPPKSEVPAPRPGADALRSPFTPTPASVQRRAQGSSGNESFHTAQEYLDEHLTAPAPPAPDPLESPRVGPQSLPPTLDTPSAISAFDPDFDAPIVESPSPIDASLSEIFDPSIPSPSSYVAPENNIRTTIPDARPVEDNLIVEEVTLPGIPEGSMLLANDSAEVPHAHDVATTARIDSLSLDIANIPRDNADSISDLYTNRAVDPPMPTAKVGPDGRELRFDLIGGLGSAPITVRFPSISFLPVSSPLY